MAILGASNTGKSTYIRQLWNSALKDVYTKVFVFTTDSNTSYYKSFLPRDACIITDPSTFLRAFNMIGKIQDKNVVGYQRDGEPQYRDKILIIFDDIVDEKFIKDQLIANAVATWRHKAVSFIFSIQATAKYISEMIKNNASHIVYFRLNSGLWRVYEVLAQTEQFIHCSTETQAKALAKNVYTKFVRNRSYGKLVVDTVKNKLYYG